ncbi:MAG TPA: protein kinase [Terriglobales bacterium]|nr:protein kinase [Terriglobales bacterium]
MPFSRAPWWMYIVAASLLGNFALNVYVYLWGPEPPFSQYNFARTALVVEEVLPNSAGDRAGLQVGDRVLAIGGRRVLGLGQWDLIRINFEIGKPYRLQVERDGKSLEPVMTLRRRSWSQQAQYKRISFVLNTAGALLTLLVAFLVAFTRPYDWVARIGALSIALLGGSAYLYGTAAIIRRLPIFVGALIWWPEVGSFIFPALFFAFCSIFPRQLFRARWIWLANLPALFFLWPIVGFAYFTFVNPAGENNTPDWGPRVGASLLFAYVGAGLVALILNYRWLDDVNQRRRIRVLVAGTLVGYLVLVPYVVMDAMRTSAHSNAGRVLFSWPALLLVNVFYQAFPLSWAYAILRHRLFDVRVILRRGLQYALARRVLLTVVPALGILLLADLLSHGQQPLLDILHARGWIYVVLGGLAITAYVKRQSWLEALDRRFFRERYDAHRLQREVVEEVRAARSFGQVAPGVVTQIETALHPEFVSLLAREPGEPSYRSLAVAPSGFELAAPLAESKLMSLVRLLGKPLEVPQTGSDWLKDQLPQDETAFLRRSRIELIVPIATSPERTEALLLLGLKRSEEPYSREDLDLLVAVASSLALLLEKPPGTAAVRSDHFEECLQCGTCYDSGTRQCPRESAQLVPVILPRVLGGRYQLERRLGRGGMGTVYLASDLSLERQVAVKVIRDDLVGSADAAERFRREARVAASFAHPNVVTVHDFGVVARTRAFLVMELLQGGTVREELSRQKRFAAPRVVSVLGDACSALESAHHRQLVHRDLKPENIFLVAGRSGETAKILDFGIAKFLSTATLQPTADTTPGAVMGTLRYMSPEQWRGGEPSALWDLWALAVVAYEMLTGIYPFEGHSPADWLRAGEAAKFVPLAAHLPEGPHAGQEFFQKAFAVDSAFRPRSADEFHDELRRAFG